MIDKKLNIYISDIRGMLDANDESDLAKSLLDVLTIDEVLDEYSESDIREWLEDNAGNYGYVKED